MKIPAFIIAAILGVAGFCAIASPDPRIIVQADQPGHVISPALWGIFFEDINCSADGGLYAELVRNRNFQDAEKPDHWNLVTSGAAKAEMAVETNNPVSPKNARYLRLKVENAGSGRVALANSGFWGISVQRGETYDLSLWARADGDFTGPLSVSLESQDSVVYAESRIRKVGSQWTEHQVSLKARETDPNARLVLGITKPGTVCLDMVSLFPRKTWKNRRNGLRPDLADMLAGLEPAFVRFPGGCWVEGQRMDRAYRWKQTIGTPAERRTQYNLWQYQATHGIGYHEYLQLCEDLKADALFVINCGMSHEEVVPMDQMGEYVQDALDAIEYANGPASSKWGAVRAKNGHPAPFKLKYLQVGNENGGRPYDERYALFYDAVKAKYPEIKIVANLWGSRPKSRPIEILDEHYYNTPDFFIRHAQHYDNYDRNGPKIYVGEYAVTQNGGQGNLRAAVGEAAFMIGMERNSDIVTMASYAPLFANVNYKKWNPDLINFDSSRVYGLPGYYVQQLFARYRGDRVLPTTVNAVEIETSPKRGGIGVGTWLTQAEFKDMRVTSGDKVLFAWDPAKGTDGWRLRDGKWDMKDGALQQTGNGENIRAFIGEPTWSNYTYSLKARKLGGAEGFLVPFLVRDDRGKSWWNIGGWGNTRHSVEMDGVAGSDAEGRIETGRWYDIRVQVSPTNIQCYLDDKLIHNLPYPRLKPLVASASVDKSGVILKVVNVSAEPQETDVQIRGAKLKSEGTAIVLTSEKPEDENTLENPTKVAPMTSKFGAKPEFRHVFPPNSVTILRLPRG